MHCRRVAIRTGYSRCVHSCHGITAVPVGITSCFKNSASSFIKRPGSLRGPRVIFKSTADVRAPNITGEFPNNDNEYEKYYSGAFSIGSVRLSGYSDTDVSTGQTGLFRASWSSSTYGSSTTVQPASVRSLFCIKS